jgi:Mitochondrial ribosomal death-associated protein 3
MLSQILLRVSQRRILPSQLLHPVCRATFRELPVVSNESIWNGAPQTAKPFSTSFGNLNFETLSSLDDSTNDDPDSAASAEKLRRAEETRQELLKKKGRGWTDPWDIDELLESNVDHESLPDWSPQLVSRISQERVQIYNVNDSKIPLLSDLAVLPLPPPPHPQPGLGQTKAYALHRKRAQYKHILSCVTAMAEPHIQSILSLSDWQDKQDAVDVLFEDIERTLKEKEVVLGKHPSFGLWVERALEEYLQSVRRRANAPANNEIDASTADDAALVTTKRQRQLADETAVPIFMDCYDSGRGDSEENAVPNILIPLQPNSKGQSAGRMVEEWELSAHKTSKRIMLRQCTRQIAQALMTTMKTPPLTETASTDSEASAPDDSLKATETNVGSPATAIRIFVHGRRGVGKTAAMAAVVASARVSGCIVVYLPEGDQLHKNGFYIEPNAKRPGVFDLPILTKSVCQNLLDVHRDDLAAFEADEATMEAFFTDDQLSRLKGYDKGGSITLSDLLSFGAEKADMAPMCYSAAVDVLMKQDEKPFIMVLDEFNCFFQPGQYFHQDFDMEVTKPIPYTQISLFAPILNAMAMGPPVPSSLDTNKSHNVNPVLMKRGAVIVGTTESHAVARSITDAVTSHAELMQSQAASPTLATEWPPPAPLHVITVPQLSTLEVEHMLANYEATGVGKLRLDRGETIMNAQEVNFLRMVSGGEAQHLMNACMM